MTERLFSYPDFLLVIFLIVAVRAHPDVPWSRTAWC